MNAQPRPDAVSVTAASPAQPGEAAPVRLSGGWLTVARAAWLLFFGVLLVLIAANIGPRIDELMGTCAGPDCRQNILTTQAAAQWTELGLSQSTYVALIFVNDFLVIVVFFAMGLLIFRQRSHELIGLLVSFALIFTGAAAPEVTFALADVYPVFYSLLTSIGAVALTTIFFVYPDGRFVPRWTRWFALAFVLMTAGEGPLYHSLRSLRTDWVANTIFILDLLLLGVAFYSQVLRYRGAAGPVQRQQYKWALLGATSLIVGVIAWSLLFDLKVFSGGQQPGLALIVMGQFGLTMLALVFPISLGFAVLRYRLWDIDVIIRRTLLYVTLTGVLALGYVGSVVLLQAAFRTLTGQASSLAIIVSTLVIAALFTPLRRRVQAFIDRRFYRSQYDAQITLQAFGERARDEVDLDTLQEALLAVVEDTLKPSHTSLWTREE